MGKTYSSKKFKKSVIKGKFKTPLAYLEEEEFKIKKQRYKDRRNNKFKNILYEE